MSCSEHGLQGLSMVHKPIAHLPARLASSLCVSRAPSCGMRLGMSGGTPLHLVTVQCSNLAAQQGGPGQLC